MERFAQLQGRGGEGSCGLIRKKMSDADALNNLQHDGRTDEEWAELRWQIDPARHEYGVTSESQFSSSHQLNMGSLFNILFFGRFDGTQVEIVIHTDFPCRIRLRHPVGHPI